MPNFPTGRIPRPAHRHAAPAGPWPFIDSLADQESDEVIDAKTLAVIGSCGHDNCEDCKNWTAYPQSHFGNWTIKPVRKCGIERAVQREKPSTIYMVDVLEDGVFGVSSQTEVTAKNKREYWRDTLLREREGGIRVRALFVDRMSGPVLQMLGSIYNVEPFFFSSSINWMPSRYQENVTPKTGDHITVTLTFMRSMDTPTLNDPSTSTNPSKRTLLSQMLSVFSLWSYFASQIEEIGHIDTLAPMNLHSCQKILYPDFLGLHMVRDVKGSTIISYHHDIDGRTASAPELYTRLKLVGRSVYWQLIVRNSKDPTFVFLVMLWSAVYAWDEALEALQVHFSWLEARVINTNNVALTYELHVIRAHLLHYKSLLRDLRKSVEFVRGTVNPAMESDDIDDAVRNSDNELLERECENIFLEVDRLTLSRQTLDDRVQNVQNLVYATINIDDSRAMKRLSYITMIFLPATFLANAFSMNVTELNPQGGTSLGRFFEATVPLSFFTIWIILAFQSRFVLRDNRGSFWRKLLWPIAFLKTVNPWSARTTESPAYELPIRH